MIVQQNIQADKVMVGVRDSARRLPVLIVISLLFVGCDNVGPDYQVPKLAVPAQFPDRQGYADGAVGLTRWWTSFHDAELDSLVAKSLAANHQRRLALARLAESRALLGVAHAQGGPTLSGNGTANYLGIDSHDIMPLETAPTGLYEAGFDCSWEVDIWGAVRREKEGALAEVEAAQLDVLGVANTVAAEVTRDWLQLRYLQTQRHLAEEQVRLTTAQRDIVQKKRTHGLATDADMAAAQAAVAAAEANLPLLVAAEEQTRHSISALIGEAPGQNDASLAVECSLPALPGELAVGVPADLLRRRPDLRRVERQLAAATARVGVAKADLYPRLTLSGSFVMFSTQPRGLVSNGSILWFAGPTVRWNLLDWGRVRSLIKVADARVEQALVAYQGTLLLAQKDVADALSALEQDRQRAEAAERCWRESLHSEQLTAELRQRGLTDDLTVLLRRQATLQAEILRQQVQLAQLLDTVALAKALGGGWEPDAALASVTAQTPPTTATLERKIPDHD
ncbi:MAG: efflux transporter outer membrane subunit [Tepidisphaeraceae bacterium]